MTVNGDLDVNGILTTKGTKTVTCVQPSAQQPAQQKPAKDDKLADFLKNYLHWEDSTIAKWAPIIESCAPNVTTGIMTMAADLLTGQKLGWSVLGGMISGLTVKDGEFNKYLGGLMGGGLISNAFGTNIANMMTGIAGAAATGATTAVATGASITTTVAASVSTNLKTEGSTLTPAPKDDGQDDKKEQSGSGVVDAVAGNSNSATTDAIAAGQSATAIKTGTVGTGIGATPTATS